MFYNMLIRSLDRNPQNSGEVFQNAENRVWGRFQNVWKNIHPCKKGKKKKGGRPKKGEENIREGEKMERNRGKDIKYVKGKRRKMDRSREVQKKERRE